MHELSIAIGIVELAEKEAHKAGGNTIEDIELVIGKISGIELEALEFVWPSAVKDTMLENSVMKIISIAGLAKCVDCNHEFKIEHLYDSCPKCNSYFKDIIEGKEMYLKSISIK
jgi:hydrogenase nickel incorporation protein HypA/HybF